MKPAARCRWVLLFVACLTLAGCSRKIERTELIGKYALKGESASQTLELLADGSYTETVTSPDGVETISRNRWGFIDNPGVPWVDLQLPNGDHFLDVRQSIGGRLRLYESSGNNALFDEKIQ